MFSQDLKDKSLKTQLGKAIIPYKKFKNIYTTGNSIELEGKLESQTIHSYQDNIFDHQGYDSELNLRYVRIYFYATTFDKITKDRAAKFVDKLSAIGGTMGLLTGFSIISGVEILYFGLKIILKILMDRSNKKQLKQKC